MRLLGWPLTILVITSVEVGVRIDAVEFAGLDQRSDDRPVLAAAIGTGEERILPVQGDWADLRSTTLESISMRPSSTKRVRPFPARERIADCLGEFGLLTDQSELGPQPRFKVIKDRSALVLAHSAALVRAAATDFLLDGVETGDALERLAGNRRGTRRSELVEAAADV